MSAHTPGPWRRNIKPASKYNTIFAGDAKHIASLSTAGMADDEMEANCNLIAAAPELLEALREIADDYADRFDMTCPGTNPGIKYVVEQARAAIAKATGA